VRYHNVVVGGGLAGGMVAQEYREQGGDDSILIIASEPHLPYHRPPLTKDFLRGEKPAEDGQMHPAEWWREHDVEIRTETRVVALDPGAHQVTLESGEEISYERLALATGATPRTIPGTSAIRTVDDSAAVAAVLEEGSGELGVIGGGFIGVEAAASARMKGFDVTMAVPESVVWEHVFGAEVARYFQNQLESHGVTVLNGTTQLPEKGYKLVLAGIGVNPNIELAQDAGLATNSVVLVNEQLSAGGDIWAVGDIAEYQSVVHGKRMRVEHWDVALNQGAYVGRTWAGKQDGPYDVVPYFFSDIGDWTWFEYVGPGSGKVDIRGSMDSDDFCAYYTDESGATVACLGVNRSDAVEGAKELIKNHEPPPAD
jgi:3-phenylpropionate/trans-cinnamate dioxygenase ferredoxin reductase component